MCDFCQKDKRFAMTFKTIKGQELSWCRDCEYEIMYQEYQKIKLKQKIKR